MAIILKPIVEMLGVLDSVVFEIINDKILITGN